MTNIRLAGQALIAWLSGLKFSRLLPSKFDRDDSRLIIRSMIIGAVVWGPVFLLRIFIDRSYSFVVEWLVRLPSPVFVILPLCMGAVIVAVIARYRGSQIIYYDQDGNAHALADVEGDGLERAIALYHTSEPSFERAMLGKEGVDLRWELPTYSLALRKMAATWATLGSGGSGGLEGSVALMGESLAVMMFKPRLYIREAGRQIEWLRRPIHWWSMKDVDQLQTAQLSGIAAAVATLTGAPFMSAFFAAEVMYRRRPLIEKLIYSLVSTLVAYFLSSVAQSGHHSLFAIENNYLPPANWPYYGIVIMMAVAVALISIYFVRLRKFVDHAFHAHLPDTRIRLLTGAVVTGLVAMTIVMIVNESGEAVPVNPFSLILGTGSETIEVALAGKLTLFMATIALVGKILTTVITIGSGGSAGLLIPSLYLGALIASIIAALIHYEPMLLIAPAMTASLASIANVPLAAILLPVELFSAHYLPASLLALIICTFLTEGNKIYRTQRETFDKRQILPGVEVRRLTAPMEWNDRTVIDLDLRRRFEVTVIGVLELPTADNLPKIRLDTSASLPLREGDALVMMGSPTKLDLLEQSIQADQKSSAESKPSTHPHVE